MITTPAIAASEVQLPSRHPGPSGDVAGISSGGSHTGSNPSLSLRLLSITLALSCAGCGHSPATLTAFRTEQQAQEHCPSDTVVWVDPQSGAYYVKNSASYGHVGVGRYACRGEAEGAGMREIAN
jgi:hypothetical protein